MQDSEDGYLNDYFQLKDKELREHSIGIAEGRTLVDRLFDSSLKIRSVLSTPANRTHYEKLSSPECPVIIREPGEIGGIVGFKFHRAVLAAFQRPEFTHLGSIGSLLQVAPGKRLFADCSGIQEGSNLGAIIRSARAFNLGGIILGPKSADPFSRKAVRASAGWVFSMPLLYTHEPEKDIAELKTKGFRLLAAETREHGAVDLSGYRSGMNAADQSRGSKSGPAEILLLGHEFTGIRPALLKHADALLEIPMNEDVDSLNVGVAAGIFFYALSRAAGS